MLQTATNAIQNNLQYLPVAALVLNGAIILETAVRVPIDLYKVFQASVALDEAIITNDGAVTARKELNDRRYDLGADLGHLAFYGLCAASVFPGSIYVGATVLIAYSIFRCKNEDAYYTTKLVGKPIRAITDQVIWPLVCKISNTAAKVLKALGNLLADAFIAFTETLATICHHAKRFIPSFRDPVWLGVAALITVAAVVKFTI